MNVDTGTFTKLTAELDRMAALVNTLTAKFEAMSTRALVSEFVYETGRRDERMAIQGGAEGRARRRNPPRGGGSRAGYLHAVEAERRPS